MSHMNFVHQATLRASLSITTVRIWLALCPNSLRIRSLNQVFALAFLSGLLIGTTFGSLGQVPGRTCFEEVQALGKRRK